MEDAADWSEELDALRFAVPGHGAYCAVHRLAFKAVLGPSPADEAALAFFQHHQAAFVAAALAKIKRANLPAGRSLHLNSRDIRRAIAGRAAITQHVCAGCWISDNHRCSHLRHPGPEPKSIQPKSLG